MEESDRGLTWATGEDLGTLEKTTKTLSQYTVFGPTFENHPAKFGVKSKEGNTLQLLPQNTKIFSNNTVSMAREMKQLKVVFNGIFT